MPCICFFMFVLSVFVDYFFKLLFLFDLLRVLLAFSFDCINLHYRSLFKIVHFVHFYLHYLIVLVLLLFLFYIFLHPHLTLFVLALFLYCFFPRIILCVFWFLSV